MNLALINLARSSFTKLIVFAISLLTITAVSIYKWEQHINKQEDSLFWTLVGIDSGTSFTVTRREEFQTIELCGVVSRYPNSPESKEYLKQVIELGDGMIRVEEFGSGHEAWITLKPNYNQALVRHLSREPNALVGKQLHLSVLLLQRGFVKRNRLNYRKCWEPPKLVRAENSAKKKKRGIWKN